MHEFLKNIADGYILAERTAIDRHIFVFPNARSAAFFRTYFAGKTDLDSVRLNAMCITLTELVEKASGRRRATSERLLMMLYRAYRNVKARDGADDDATRSFDSFRFWGEMILNDFSDVDKYMADPVELFRNIRSEREIQTFYLTKEQIDIIREYWGEDPYWQPVWQQNSNKELPFWNHVKGNTPVIKKFTQLWQMLGPLYAEFHRLLDLSGECYPGMAYRVVADMLLRGERLKFNARRFVFIGFNRLSNAAHIIFDRLDRLGLAHFYWDFDPVMMNSSAGNKAGRFISGYVKAFSTALPEVKLPSRAGNRCVDVIGVPSNVGQAKVAAQLLTEPGSAVVLASEDLLLPMVHSVPEEFKQINVTMGYPLRFSAISQLFSLIMSLQMRARRSSDGDIHFFRDDVMALLSSPLVQARFRSECETAVEFLKTRHIFNLPASLAQSEPVFAPLRPLLAALPASATLAEVAAYVKSLLEFSGQGNLLNKLDLKCAEVITSQIDQIAALAAEFDVDMSAHTFLRLIERTVFQRSMAMEGKSFDAMQIMGVLETRALGFDHVVMLSMTDAIYPGRRHGSSFIPETLRRAYGLPTRDHLEADYAYYFYRLLSNAKHLTLLYDSRTGGLRSGEMSRFIFQLRYLDFPGVSVNMKMASFATSSPRELAPLIGPKTEVAKTPEVMERLNRYRNPKLCKTYSLSASTIKKYISCPLSFYFERVEDIRPPEDEKEDVDAGILGNIVHEVAERVYSRLAGESGGTITSDMLARLVGGGFDGLLTSEIHRALRVHVDMLSRVVVDDESGELCPNPALETAALSDKAEFYVRLVTDYVNRLFRSEQTPFNFKAAELSETFVWKNVAPGIDVNFTMKIDRLDSVNEDGEEILRVIDYKTGSDVTHFSDIDRLFLHSDPDPKHPRAIFQLFTYCAAFKDFHGSAVDTTRLRPQIFPLRDIETNGFPLITTTAKESAGAKRPAKEEVRSFAEVETEFRSALAGMFAELFNPEIPFTRAEDKTCCTYCNFRRFCYTTPD